MMSTEKVSEKPDSDHAAHNNHREQKPEEKLPIVFVKNNDRSGLVSDTISEDFDPPLKVQTSGDNETRSVHITRDFEPESEETDDGQKNSEKTTTSDTKPEENSINTDETTATLNTVIPQYSPTDYVQTHITGNVQNVRKDHGRISLLEIVENKEAKEADDSLTDTESPIVDQEAPNDNVGSKENHSERNVNTPATPTETQSPVPVSIEEKHNENKNAESTTKDEQQLISSDQSGSTSEQNKLPKRPPPLRIATSPHAHSAHQAELHEPKHGIHMHPPWQKDTSHKPESHEPDATGEEDGHKKRNFGKSVRHAFSNLRRSFKKKSSKPKWKDDNQFHTAKTTDSTGYEGHVSPTHIGEAHLTHSQLSMQPSLEVSLTNSPELPRQRHSEPGSPELRTKMPHNVTVTETPVNDTHVYANSNEINQQQNIRVHPKNVTRPQTSSGSLDRRLVSSGEYSPPKPRRTQTMKHLDYPSRFRERVSTYRPASREQHDTDTGGTMRSKSIKHQPERYVCSEVYNWPPKFPKFKRRHPSPPKQIRSGHDVVISKPQLKADLGYQIPSPAMHIHSQEPIVINKMERAQAAAKPTQTGSETDRQVTSLQSVQVHALLAQSTRVAESGREGLLRTLDHKPAAQNESGNENIQYVHVPRLRPATARNICTRLTNTTNPEQRDGETHTEEQETHEVEQEKSAMLNALNEIYPFFEKWTEHKNTNDLKTDEEKDESVNQSADKLVSEKQYFEEYLYACVRLHSVDLEGEFASFHYPLQNFDESTWTQCGKVEKWPQLKLLRQPNTETEYVLLPPVNLQTCELVYSNKTADNLIQQWLDNRQSVMQKCKTTGPILHSSLAIITLAHLLKYTTESQSESTGPTKIYELSFKLIVLLNLLDCMKNVLENSDILISTNPEDILLIISPTNCLVIFKKPIKPSEGENDANKEEGTTTDTTDQANQDSNTNLVKDLLTELHMDSDVFDESIDSLIQQLYQLTDENVQLKTRDLFMLGLLRALVPPNWITIMLARIYLKESPDK